MTQTIRTVGIVPFGREYLNDGIFSRDPALDRDGSLLPLRALRDDLRSRGLQAETIDRIAGKPDVWLHFDAHRPPPTGAAPHRTVVVVWEPEVVAPFWYRVLRRGAHPYSSVWLLSSDLSNRNRVYRTYFPHDLRITGRIEDPRSIDLVMINANKKPRHKRGELYSLRRTVAAELARSESIVVYGRGWDVKRISRHQRDYRSIRASWAGAVPTKSSVLRSARFCLCFENSIHPGYRTEKILDAMAAGSIPIYFGDPSVHEEVPGGFIDFRTLGTAAAVKSLVKSIDPVREDSIRLEGFDYLGSSRADVHSVARFVQDIGGAVLRASKGGSG